jgi:cytochrome b561
MPADRIVFRFVSNSIDWLLRFGTFVLLGSGWLTRDTDLTQPDRQFWIESHTSLGLSCTVLLLLRALLWTIQGPATGRDRLPRWRRQASYMFEILWYLSLVATISAGYLGSVASGSSISYFGIPLPQFETTDLVSASTLGEIHRVGGFVAGGSIFLHLVLSNLAFRRRGPIADVESAPPPSEGSRVPAMHDEADARQATGTSLVVARTAKNLAHNLRLFGWVDFWAQFVLAMIVGLLLAFAASGVAFSPSRPGFGNAINWGLSGFGLLIPSILLAFCFVRAGKRVIASPIDYLHHEKRLAFWFLWIGLAGGGLGVLVSFVGVGMSISLLIVKTISQPPGIAITDPNNIIRALDVFVLIVNFLLLIAHFIGVVTALWLGFCASKARVDFISAHGRPVVASG